MKRVTIAAILICTCSGCAASKPAVSNASLPLETSVHGIFAIGDVRSGSVKRVGGAIGEGAAVVAQIHGFLADHLEQAQRARH